MIAIRREDADAWPCPWLKPTLDGCSSRPEYWDLTDAKSYVDDNRSKDNLVAVYHVKGFIHKKIWPQETKGVDMKKKGMLMALAVVLFAGCAGTTRSMSKGQVKDVWKEASDKNYIRTRGMGAAPEGVSDLTQRRGMSRNAALVAARYEMLQVIKGLRVTGGLTVEKLIQTDGRIAEVADKIVAGSEEVQTEWGKGDGCVVLIQLDRDEVVAIVRRTMRADRG